LSDKRRVRRDLVDVFVSSAEGVRGKRALDWRLVDEIVGKSQFEAAIARWFDALRARSAGRAEKKAIAWNALEVSRSETGSDYEYVCFRVEVDKRLARITVEGPRDGEPTALGAMHERGAALWALRAFRELDDALLDLRFNYPKIGLI